MEKHFYKKLVYLIRFPDAVSDAKVVDGHFSLEGRVLGVGDESIHEVFFSNIVGGIYRWLVVRCCLQRFLLQLMPCEFREENNVSPYIMQDLRDGVRVVILE